MAGSHRLPAIIFRPHRCGDRYLKLVIRIDRTICRWKITNITISGSIAATDAAITNVVLFSY